MIGVLFWSLILAGCAYAATGGKRDGQWAAFLIVSASLLTIPALRLDANWQTTQFRVLMVDTALLLGLYALALQSRRYFPIWMTGFHLIAVTTHLATIIAPAFTPRVYRAMEGLWGVPMMVSMVVGIALDRRWAITD